jgi:hypothetical protein
MTKAQRIREFFNIVLEEDVKDLNGVSVKEATTNFGVGIVMVFGVALHLLMGAWQIVVSLLLVGYDLIVKGLTRVMPGTDKIRA